MPDLNILIALETKAQNILITGGSGLVGRQLTAELLQAGNKVAWLSRSERSDVHGVEVYQWDVRKMELDRAAIEWADVIIHLAGEGVANKRWTGEQKTKILDSRIDSTGLLYDAIKEANNPPIKFISASAIGYYGYHSADVLLDEEASPGSDFLADVTKAWELEVDRIASLGVATVKLRIGVVLSKSGGALEKMSQPVRYGVGAALGSGNQIVSWVHVDDLCGIIEFTIEHNSSGVYNAVAPNPVTNKVLMKSIAGQLHKPFFLPAVPGFVMKLMLGEMSEILLQGSNVSAQRIKNQGYDFKFPNLDDALSNLLK